MNISKRILPVIVTAQFLCTSLWFAGNGIMTDLIRNFSLHNDDVGSLTSAVQLGFIVGTLIFALLSIADRYSPSLVFFACAISGAVFNLGIIWVENNLTTLLTFRFFTGFFLAGIYPVGMKIAADYYEKGLGKSLGYLVGALVLGTAFPHLLKNLLSKLSWEIVVFTTSALSMVGGVLMILLVPDGPFRKQMKKLNPKSVGSIFRVRTFRDVAIGYFGHMWELYTFWALVPVLLKTYEKEHNNIEFNIPLLSFLIIGIGGLACILVGFLSLRINTKKLAIIILFLSCVCCLVSPIFFLIDSPLVFITFLMCWGMVVIADSPLLSTLVAKSATQELKGSSLTIVNSIGFFVTIISIQTIMMLRRLTDSNLILMIIALGPIIGLISLVRKKQ